MHENETKVTTTDDDQLAPPRRSKSRVALIVAMAAVLAVGSYWLGTRDSKSAKAPTEAEVAATIQSAMDSAAKKSAGAPAKSVQVFQTIVPSLVIIRTGNDDEEAAADTTPRSPAELKKQSEQGLGTGVIISAEGAILTANHVVASGQPIHLIFADGTRANATVEKAEPDRDIAVLSADRLPSVVVPAVMGGGVRIGDEAYAVGHPLGLVDSLSAGVISGLNRSIPLRTGKTLDGLIQFDAAVNPGNSGGPLLNRSGQVVGIVTALANPSDQGFFVGIGFAVPIAAASGAAGGPSQ